uniref:Uncharacterized protein n=1 Tax=Saccharum officinarum TaxID=4547 RepID=A0A678T8U6_SACOF|nr:hypothetical protein SO37C23_000007 [Saccharum officinarum]
MPNNFRWYSTIDLTVLLHGNREGASVASRVFRSSAVVRRHDYTTIPILLIHDFMCANALSLAFQFYGIGLLIQRWSWIVNMLTCTITIRINCECTKSFS